MPERDAETDERVVPAGVLSHQQQGVAQLQIVDRRGRRADVRILHHRAADEAGLPSGGLRSQREIRFLAVGEVALVEDAHV